MFLIFSDSFSVDFSVGAKSAHEPLCITEGQGHLGIGKSNRITDLCWSPHQDGLLASAGYNGVAIVSNRQQPRFVLIVASHSLTSDVQSSIA